MIQARMEKTHDPEKGIRYYYKEDVHKHDTHEDPEPTRVKWTLKEISDQLGTNPQLLRARLRAVGMLTKKEPRKVLRFDEAQTERIKLVHQMASDGVHLWKIKETLNKKS